MALLLKNENSTDCCCPPMTGLVDPRPSTPPPASDPDKKYFHEVGAEMIGNRLLIRMEKDKSKRGKKRGAWEPPCDCDVVEIKRPTATKGPRIVNGGDNNQILFRMHSKAHLNKKEDPNYKPQAIAYKINRSGTDSSDHCRKITVYPQLGGPVSQEVYSDHISEAEHDVYLLRVKKKNDDADGGNRRNLEVELRTPKPPPPQTVKPKVAPPAEPQPSDVKVTEKKDAGGEVRGDTKKNGKNGKKGKKK